MKLTVFQLLSDCICLAPCKGRCKVCGVVLCSMTKKWKHDCNTCATWLIAVMDKYLGTHLLDNFITVFYNT